MTYCLSPSLPRLDGGVRRYSEALPGSLGAGRGGSTGDVSPSPTVEVLETGEDLAEGRDGEAPVPSCAEARGGVDVFEEYVFRGLGPMDTRLVLSPKVYSLAIFLKGEMAEDRFLSETYHDEISADETRIACC